MTKEQTTADELGTFKDRISALIESDAHEMMRTGLANKSNYHHGDYLTTNDITDIIEEALGSLSDLPVSLMSASEIHDTFNFCGFEPIEGGDKNILHAIKLFEGSEVTGYIFIDDTTNEQPTAIHMAFDNEYSRSAIYSYITEIDDFDMSFYSVLDLPKDKEAELARSAKVRELLSQDKTYESLDATEQILLLSIMNKRDFKTKDQYEDTIAKRTDVAIYNSGYDHNTITMIGDLLIEGEGQVNYVIVDYEPSEPEARTVIIEKAGNVLISNQDGQLFKHKEGDKFTFKGEEFIAGKDITNDIELVLCGTHRMLSEQKNSKFEETPTPAETRNKKFKI